MMKENLIKWDVYEIKSKEVVHGVKLRGRLRKKALSLSQNLLIENATDVENTVRFAVISNEDIGILTDYLKSIFKDITIVKIDHSLENPVLSKIKVNNIGRYEI